MTSIHNRLFGTAVAAVVLGLGAASSASAWSFGETVPDGPERIVVDPNDRTIVPDGPELTAIAQDFHFSK